MWFCNADAHLRIWAYHQVSAMSWTTMVLKSERASQTCNICSVESRPSEFQNEKTLRLPTMLQRSAPASATSYRPSLRAKQLQGQLNSNVEMSDWCGPQKDSKDPEKWKEHEFWGQQYTTRSNIKRAHKFRVRKNRMDKTADVKTFLKWIHFEYEMHNMGSGEVFTVTKAESDFVIIYLL